MKYTEKLVFLFCVILFSTPFITTSYFATLDGPAHLYNAQLIKTLLTENNDKISSFFKFNSEIVPNLIGHIYLVILKFFTTSLIAEKALLLSYAFGLSYSFRALIRVISPERVTLSYFIFPFIYSFVFALGFYNFSIGIILMILSIRYYLIINEKQKFTFKNIILFTGLLLLTFYSHALNLVFTLIAIATHKTFVTLYTIGFKKYIQQFVVNNKFILITFILPLILFLNYYIPRITESNQLFLSKKELLFSYINIRPLIVYSYEIDLIHTRRIFYLIALTIIISFLYILKNKSILLAEKIKKIANPWFIIAFILFIMSMILPDQDLNGGFVSVRFIYIFFIFILLGTAFLKPNKKIILIILIPYLFTGYQLVKQHNKTIVDLNNVAKECVRAGKFIPDNSVVLPYDLSNNWMLGHFSNYLGPENKIIILENYECFNNYFPLNWNYDKIPKLTLSNQKSDNLETNIVRGASALETKIDYLFILGDRNDMKEKNPKIDSLLNNSSKSIYLSKKCSLYKLD